MLIVNQDKTRKEEEGQIFVELTIYRDVRNIADCNRLGYWCDKAHLSHFIMSCAKYFTQDELKNILKMNGNNIYIEKNNLLDAYKNGKLGAVFRPYIQWKTGGPMFSKEQAYAMINTVSDLLNKMFDDAEADEELRSYLEGIDSEITNILPTLI